MSKPKSIHVYDYVNHPYEQVREALSTDAVSVFGSATRAAAKRAEKVASELHANVAGIDVGAEIEVRVTTIEDRPRRLKLPATTKIVLEWKASRMPRLFPIMNAELSIYPLTADETQLDLDGQYEVPLGALGSAIDAVVGHRIAEASVHRFIKDVATYLRKELG